MNSIIDKEKCIAANLAYEAGNDNEMLRILNDDDIRCLPCALNNKGYYCYLSDYGFDPIHLLKNALSIAPQNYKTLLLLGKIYFENGNYELSLDMFKKAANVKPDAVSLNNAGTAAHFLKRFGESEEYFRKASKTDRKGIAAYNLALEYALNDKRSEAEQLVSQIEPNDETDNIDLGRIYFLLENYKTVCNFYGADWNSLFPSADVTGIYLYSLKQTGMNEKFKQVKTDAINWFVKFIEDIEDKENAAYCSKQFEELKETVSDIEHGNKPKTRLNPKMKEACYLYYCAVHGNDTL